MERLFFLSWELLRHHCYFTNTLQMLSRCCRLLLGEDGKKVVFYQRQFICKKFDGKIQACHKGTEKSKPLRSKLCTDDDYDVTPQSRVRRIYYLCKNLYLHDVTRSLTRFNHVDIQVVTIRFMTCQ